VARKQITLESGQIGCLEEEDKIYFSEVQGEPRNRNYPVSTAQVGDLVCLLNHGEAPSLITAVEYQG